MIVFHIDVNNAFLSWESIERLKEASAEGKEVIDLRTIPSAIGGHKESRHGIILAKSTPAKKFGVKTAETLNDALKKCPSLTIVPPRMELYRNHSAMLMKLLTGFSDTIEQYSIDEAFVDMTGTELLFGPPLTAATRLQNEIKNNLGFTVNIGISSNKILAKMASDFEKPDKVHSLFPDEIQKKMWPLPVNQLFFVGNATTRKLYNLGIHTIGELACYDKHIIESYLGKQGILIHEYANGIDPTPVNSQPADAKGYSNETTLSNDVTDSVIAKHILLELCESVGARLRADHVRANVVSILIKSYDFTRGSHQCTLPSATNSTKEIYDYCCILFDEYWDHTPIRLLGVATTKITDDDARQMSLLDGDDYMKQEKLDTAVDSIRKKFGTDAITRASFLK